ncbi:hypothetical protein B296_00006831 [Ensete ventricosum]|uniref:Uncharacterized protein n=1 Tax=Ensete ventricosum TaxID=4639 RepID=A0A427A169_ENSVE|nr:hypothetical protein B296_00006831 [Ensete ventricosum]
MRPVMVAHRSDCHRITASVDQFPRRNRDRKRQIRRCGVLVGEHELASRRDDNCSLLRRPHMVETPWPSLFASFVVVLDRLSLLPPAMSSSRFPEPKRHVNFFVTVSSSEKKPFFPVLARRHPFTQLTGIHQVIALGKMRRLLTMQNAAPKAEGGGGWKHPVLLARRVRGRQRHHREQLVRFRLPH